MTQQVASPDHSSMASLRMVVWGSHSIMMLCAPSGAEEYSDKLVANRPHDCFRYVVHLKLLVDFSDVVSDGVETDAKMVCDLFI